MAWEWSHTQEAYDNARAQLERLPDNEVAVIFAEWRASSIDEYFSTHFDSDRYPRELRRAYSWLRRGLRESMEEEIWDKASDFETGRTCTNGGWEAWLCPFGCGCHMVPFDPPEEPDTDS